MSIESAQEFFKKIKTDMAFAIKIAEAAGDAARMEIATASGFTFTLEELEEVRDELDDATLEAVAGGLNAQGDGDEEMHLKSSGEDGYLAQPANSWGMPGSGHIDKGPV